MRPHSYFAPSAAERWTACPASARLHQIAEQQGLVDDTASPYALAGTYAMALLEHMLRHGATLTQAKHPAAVGPPGPDFFWRADDEEALLTAYVWLRQIIEEADEWHIERTVSIFPEWDVWGTCDFYAVRETTLYVVDYKHGSGQLVKAESNKQLLLYAYGLLARYPHVSQVKLAICQPRHKDGGWSEVTMSRDSVLEAVQPMREAIALAMLDSPDPEVGPHCRYCPAALACPARFAEFRRIANMTEEDFADPANLRAIIAAKKRVTDLIERAERVALRRIETGAQIEGLTVVEGPGRLVWRDGAENALREAFGDVAFVTQPLSPAQVRDTLAGGAEFVTQWADRKPGWKTVRAVDNQSE